MSYQRRGKLLLMSKRKGSYAQEHLAFFDGTAQEGGKRWFGGRRQRGCLAAGVSSSLRYSSRSLMERHNVTIRHRF
jgi:hypothetical protein